MSTGSPFVKRLIKHGPTTDKTREKTKKNYYAAYSQNKLMLSGDIEKQPGPMKINAIKIISILLLTSFLLLIIGISSYNMKGTENTPKMKQTLMSSTSLLKRSLDSIGNLLILRNNKKKNYINIRTRAAYLVILLLLAGDIHPRPGPTSEGICLVCKKQENNKFTLTCETCNGWSHVSCANKGKNQILLDKSYEWLCPNPTCFPNYHPSEENTLEKSTVNRYDLLLKPISPQKESRIHQKRPQVSHNKSKKQTNYMKFLPKITSKDYIGKELCNKCCKLIKEKIKIVKCKVCASITHIRCSDMSFMESKNINNKKPVWSCLSCRTDEEITNEKFDILKCTEDQLPEEWKDVLKGKRKDEDIILHLNACSVVNKADEFEDISRTIKPAAMFATESWMDESCPKGTAVPEGYYVIRKDRTSEFKQKYGKKNGGGIAIFVRKGVKISIETHMNDNRNEILWCTLKLNKIKYLIGVIYRGSYTDLLKPDSEGNMEMEELLHKALDRHIMLIGDLNCDTSKAKVDQDADTRKLTNLAEEYELKQLIEKPTRFADHIATTIDHIWVRDDSLVRKAGTCPGISDHCGIYAYIREKLDVEERNIRCRNFKSFNAEEYKEDIVRNIKDSNFQEELERKDVNAAFNSWINSLKEAADKHAPWKEFKKKTSQNIPWLSNEVGEVRKTKNMYLKLYRLYRRPEDHELYKIAKNKQTHLSRKCKREYYTRKIEEYKGDSKKMWNILNDVTNRNYKEDITPDVVDEETANRFNHFFANVGLQVQKKLNVLITRPNLNKHGNFKFHPESIEKVEYLIRRIKPNVATGHDELSERLIKEATPVILEDLKNLINLSYETCTFPDQLKTATVKALHKKGGNNDPAQYRPVSILTTVSKVFERSAVEQLTNYYDSIKLLNPRQHAYRKNHSTTTILFELIETTKRHIDEGNYVAIASLDLSKAFDSLAHNLILKKLDETGLNENATTWIESYLTNRKQTVKFGNIESKQETVESGVPQGSILGPLLFITCTNDIIEELKDYDIYSYADDMQILIKGKSVEQLGKKLEVAIQKANSYYNNNSLLCNPTKTEVMLLGTKIRLSQANNLKVKVSNEEETKILTGQDSLKILGVNVDQSIDWTKHTSIIKQRALNSIRNLHRINQLIPMKQRRILYTSLVTPHFSYADTIWNNCGITNCNKVQQAQNFAAKSMIGAKKQSSSTEALKKLQLIPLHEKRNINAAVHVKKALIGKAPENIQQMYANQLSKEETRAATRGDFNYPRHKLNQYQQGAFYTSLKTWNSIPVHLRNNSITTFKANLQAHLTEKYLGAM